MLWKPLHPFEINIPMGRRDTPVMSRCSQVPGPKTDVCEVWFAGCHLNMSVIRGCSLLLRVWSGTRQVGTAHKFREYQQTSAGETRRTPNDMRYPTTRTLCASKCVVFDVPQCPFVRLIQHFYQFVQDPPDAWPLERQNFVRCGLADGQGMYIYCGSTRAKEPISTP